MVPRWLKKKSTELINVYQVNDNDGISMNRNNSVILRLLPIADDVKYRKVVEVVGNGMFKSKYY